MTYPDQPASTVTGLSLLPAVRSRLAPTPSGYLHLGNAYSFLLTWLLVRKQGGTLHLRIDDLDTARSRPEYVADIFSTLQWMGIDYDTGPRSPEEFYQQFSQKLQLSRYERLLQQLRQAGIVYACDCSRSQIRSTTTDGTYPGTCRHKGLSLDQPNVAWRVCVPPGTRIPIPEPNEAIQTIELDRVMGDFVVRRRDGLPSYQITSLADDQRYQINLVVRGADLLPSTAAQLFMAQHLPDNSFSKTVFYHHGLLTDFEGRKLSKSAGAEALVQVRKEWQGTAPLLRRLAPGLGVDREKVASLEQLLLQFDVASIPSGKL
jgi:glutamyl/glutaminyl-tRNA synthetase